MAKEKIIITILVILLLAGIITGIYLFRRSSIDKYEAPPFNPKDYNLFDLRDYNLIDENKKQLDPNDELTEKIIIYEYLPEDSTVLELGARYGAVSLVIGNKLKNPSHHVVIEPDQVVWNALETNKSKNGGKFTIIKGVLSKTPLYLQRAGYGSTTIDHATEDSTVVPNITFSELVKETNLLFDALVVDCEGCLEKVLLDFPSILDNMKFVTFEEDYKDKCNYDWIKSQLLIRGFFQTRDKFHQVWVKN